MLQSKAEMSLFQPIDVGPARLPNRIVLPAMVTRLSGEDGYVNTAIRDRYVRFAEGQPGLIVMEAMAVHSSRSGPLLRISDDCFLPGLADVVDRVHDVSDSRIVPQIIHFLKISRRGWRQTVDMLSDTDLDEIVDAYGVAAERARRAGFDGVELHMAHAYTLASFLSRRNPRRDEYGGTLEGRLRLPCRVVERVRKRVGTDFMVGVRMLGEECIKGGYTTRDSGLIAERLARLGVDYISLSAGGKFEDAIPREGEPLYPYTGYSGDRCMPGSAYPDGPNLYMPADVRRHLRAVGLQTAVVGAGKVGSLALAERVLANGTADLVGMARALLADPDLPRKWKAGAEDRVVRCVYGNVCKALDENFKQVVCTLWPKGALQAPNSADGIVSWPQIGAGLLGAPREGAVLLRWNRAEGPNYGYEVMRAEGEGALTHYASVRGKSARFRDAWVLAGRTYRYQLRPYASSGQRGPFSDTVSVVLPSDFTPAKTRPPATTAQLDATDACTANQRS